MKKLFLTLTACILTLGLWAADVTYQENFSKIGNLNNGTSDVNGDLCTWHRTLASHRTQDTIAVNTRRAFLLPVAKAGSGKLETTDWEGGIKAVSFKYARFGSENTDGRVLQLNIVAGSVENPTPTYAKNAMKQGTGGKTTYETYDQALNCKEDAQLVIDNISTHTEAPLADNASICRILVADIVITPYILYTQKEATIGVKQQGYVNQELLKNSEDAVTFSSGDESIAKVDPATGVVTPISAGDVLIYASLAEGAKTHYTLHIVNNIVAENFSKVVQTGSASNATWYGDLFDWKANAARRGANDTIKSRPIERQQATWFSKDGYVESKAAVEGGIKNISFTWRQWSAKVAGTTTKVSVSYGGEVKAGQEFADLAANTNKSFNEDINCASAGVLKIQNTSYTTGTSTTVNNRIVIENVKITPYLLYTTKDATLYTGDALTFTNNDLINNTSGDPVEYSIAPTGEGATINNSTGEVTVDNATEGDFTITATWGAVTTTYTLHVLKPKYYITGIGGWDLKQVAVYEDSYTFEDLPADSYALKVTDGDSWDTSKGFSHLTASEVVAGLYSGGDNNNICFTLAEAGNVTVTYTNEVFKLEGAFTPQVVKVKGAWDEWATTHLMDISEDRKSASITMELPAADEVQFGIDINGDDYRANQYGFKREYNTETGITGNTGNMKLTSDKAGDYTFTWIFGTNTLTITFPEILVYRVAGDEELMGSDWNTGDDDNAMTLNEGIYKLTKTPITLNAATYKYKVVGDDTWRIAYPSDNAELTINARGVYSVEFTFNPSTKAVSAEATYLGPATAIDEMDVKAKAEKRVINGQLIIEKNGVRYNVLGQAL